MRALSGRAQVSQAPDRRRLSAAHYHAAMDRSVLILLEPLLIVLGVVALAVWQFRDLKKAREATRRRQQHDRDDPPSPS